MEVTRSVFLKWENVENEYGASLCELVAVGPGGSGVRVVKA